MSETAESTAAPTPLTTDEFDEFMAADESILELSINDLIPTLYNYKQAKQLHQRFKLPFIRGMKKERMMSDLLNLRETTRLAQTIEHASTTAAASADATEHVTVDVDEEAQLLQAAQQVAESNAEEELIDPAENLDHTKAQHGAEMADLDAKFKKLEEEMNEMRGELSTVSTTSVPKSDFTEGMTRVNLRITQQALFTCRVLPNRWIKSSPSQVKQPSHLFLSLR